MKKWVFWTILISAFLVQMLVVLPSGSHYCYNSICGLFFWGAHEHDGIWHLALINSALTSWPAKFPTYSGAVLSGYNALLDIVLSFVNFVTKIPTSLLYFKIIPFAWFGSMVWVWNKFGRIYSKSKWYVSALMFFVFFGNSFSYLFRLFHEGTIWGASGILSMQSPQMLNNIQFALTLPLLGLLLILFKKDELTWKDSLWIGCLNFLMMGLKFYGGVVAIAMSGVYVITLLFQKKWNQGLTAGIAAIIGFGLSMLIFYNPLNAIGLPAILTVKPMETVHPIIEEIGLFYAPSIANLRNNLYASGGGIRLVLIELATLLVFIVFNWGTRIIGVLSIRRKPFDYILITGILTGLLMNVLFIQRGEWWNTVQFLYYATFLSNIYAAQILSKWMDNGKLWLSLVFITIILTIPNTLDTYRIFSSYPPQSYVSDVEIDVLTHLKSLPKGTVLALPSVTIIGTENSIPKSLYSRYDTAYVAAFSGQQTYLNDLVQLRLTGIEYQDRLDAVTTNNCIVLDQVSYIYVAGNKSQIEPWEKCMRKMDLIKINQEAALYKLQ
jgi:hypothetical protein